MTVTMLMVAAAVFFVFVAAFIGITRPVACLVVVAVVRRDPGVAGFLCDTFANARSRRTASASAQYRTGSPTHRLTNGGACSTAHGATNDRATLARAGGADGGTGRAADGTANHGAVAATDRLPEDRTGRSADTAAQEGAHVIGLDRVHDRHQSQGRDQGAEKRNWMCGGVKSLHVRGVGQVPVPLNVAAYAPLTARRRAG